MNSPSRASWCNGARGLGTFSFNLRFPGQYFDSETGLFYNYFRDYDPAVGRYVESDPIGLAGSINTYAYVGGNPLSRFDVYGLSSLSFDRAKGSLDVFDHDGNFPISLVGPEIT